MTNATDPWTAQYHMKVDMLLDGPLKIAKADQGAFKEKYEISQGHWTLEWCHPSPMPFHTYEGKTLGYYLIIKIHFPMLTFLPRRTADYQGDWRKAIKKSSSF